MRTVLAGTAISLAISGIGMAYAVELSPRPEARKVQFVSVAPRPPELQTVIRPRARPTSEFVAVSEPRDAQMETSSFSDWLGAFRLRAMAQGITAGTVDRALKDVRPDPDVIRRDRNQAEFTKTIWDYLDTAVSDTRIANGRRAMSDFAETLAQIELRYGVDRHIVAAIWGLESAYGSFRGSSDVLRSLATLAHDGRRSAFFERELLAALLILQDGEVSPSDMTGSWAGAMGHTQFMPTSYLAHAVDFDGDGRRNIWGDDPTDALASTAAYLAHFGWTQGQPWGVEVQLPEGFDYTQARRDNMRPPSEWAERGVLGMDARPVPDHGPASVLLPAGSDGAAFLVFENFEVLERYNTADAYVIGVGHLADRLAGGGPIISTWPREDRALTLAEREELQARLTQRGFDTQGVDGKIGPLTIDAVRSFQKSIGATPDGYASLNILKKLR